MDDQVAELLQGWPGALDKSDRLQYLNTTVRLEGVPFGRTVATCMYLAYGSFLFFCKEVRILAFHTEQAICVVMVNCGRLLSVSQSLCDGIHE